MDKEYPVVEIMDLNTVELKLTPDAVRELNVSLKRLVEVRDVNIIANVVFVNVDMRAQHGEELKRSLEQLKGRCRQRIFALSERPVLTVVR